MRGKSRTGKIRIGYADPPYFRSSRKHYGRHHKQAGDYDRIETHAWLIQALDRRFPDGWALSASSSSLRALLPHCPPDTRIAAWCKPFAIFRPGVNPGYCWEAVLFRGGRRRPRSDPTVRDYVVTPMLVKQGLAGAKPPPFCLWLFELMGLEPRDELVDLFPGSGAVGRTWRQFQHGRRFGAK